MTRNDYELIARTIRETVTFEGVNAAVKRRIVSKLAVAFKDDNPRFDPDKFTRACGF